MSEEHVIKVSEPSISPPIFIDACEVLIHMVEDQPQQVMLLAINISPVEQEDGMAIGQVTGKWVMTVNIAEKLAHDIKTKLDRASSEVVDTHGNA